MFPSQDVTGAFLLCTIVIRNSGLLNMWHSTRNISNKEKSEVHRATSFRLWAYEIIWTYEQGAHLNRQRKYWGRLFIKNSRFKKAEKESRIQNFLINLLQSLKWLAIGWRTRLLLPDAPKRFSSSSHPEHHGGPSNLACIEQPIDCSCSDWAIPSYIKLV
jgi:hypothetical protein